MTLTVRIIVSPHADLMNRCICQARFVTEPLPEGLYEALVTDALQDRLAKHPDLHPTFGALDDADSADVLARHVAEVVRARLANTKREDRVGLVNGLLDHLDSTSESIAGTGEQLLALTANRLDATPLPRPATPLSDAALLTNAKDEPVLGSELRSELASADSVDLLCAFIRWHGLRVLEEPLTELKRRGIRIRVLTTTYVGATERRALDELVRRFGAEVKISYETQSTRLHAKAWLLRRKSGYDTAYVGSSNLSRSAVVVAITRSFRTTLTATPIDSTTRSALPEQAAARQQFDLARRPRSRRPSPATRREDLLSPLLTRSRRGSRRPLPAGATALVRRWRLPRIPPTQAPRQLRSGLRRSVQGFATTTDDRR